MVRLGAPIQGYDSPESWVAQLKELGYRAAYCPVEIGTDAKTVEAYATAAVQNDIIIAEVSAWSNPIHADPAIREPALQKCKGALALADQIGALCTVTMAGSLGDRWGAPHPDNLSDKSFDLIVACVQGIIDEVQPTRTSFTLDPMPFLHPDSVDDYVALVKAIDRPAFAAHFDTTNLINSPRIYYNNTALINDFFDRLGHITKACHVKDIILKPDLTVRLEEVIAGEGNFDFDTFLKRAHAINEDMPILLEHLPQEKYAQAAAGVRKAAQAAHIPL